MNPTIESVTPVRRALLDLRGVTPYVLVLPALMVLLGLRGYPLYQLLLTSFERYNLRELISGQGVWIGLDNYATIFKDPVFWNVTGRSLLFTAANVGLTMVTATLIGLLMQRVWPWVRLALMAVMVFVWATPVVVAIDIWQWMFDYEFGVVNWSLTTLRVGDFIHHNWFERPWEGFMVITLVVVWGAIPFVAITLYAGLTQVPIDQIEAARVDGAGAWAIFWGVTFPTLRPLFMILASLSTIWDFQVFNQIWILLNARPTPDYYLMGVYSFVASFRTDHFGLGSAIAVVMVLISLGMTVSYLKQLMASGGVE
ncbi:MAG TPA: sugar ABC transporter permease [Candidatus Dormibacteraeota bacterium]|jgi:N,N'-diacetylchitobiose transport system permease protein|nr:sugar ABC transporter permease [Candidatus Dormibacteraeota bacterium]